LVGFGQVQAKGADVVDSLSLRELNDIINAGGLGSEIKTVSGMPILDVSMSGAGISGSLQITGVLCEGNPPRPTADTKCGIFELISVLVIPSSVADQTIEQIDKDFELVSVDRQDATHVTVTAGLVIVGGITRENIGANFGAIAAQAALVLKRLNASAGAGA
jgi:hypothetical protein